MLLYVFLVCSGAAIYQHAVGEGGSRVQDAGRVQALVGNSVAACLRSWQRQGANW